MNSANIQASLHNLTQVNRVQHNENTTPIINQELNADEAKEKAARKITKPNEPEHIHDKIIDPKNRKKASLLKKKKKKKHCKTLKKHNRSRDTGRFIDFSV